MIEERFFHFTIGPVQNFVAQARRTRDFWAGSFLLSTLSAVAMREVQEQGGDVLFPIPDQRFIDALEDGAEGPQQGVIPNRFKASIGEGFDPGRVGDAVRASWIGIAKLAWQRLPKALRDEHAPLRTVWSRQIGVDLETGRAVGRDPFWRLSWAIGTADDGEDLLDRRKHLRIHRGPGEPGVKCMLMDGWQEVTGKEREGRMKDGIAVDPTWASIRETVNRRNQSDLRDDEQLCALAMVKRLFPLDFHKLRVDMPSGWSLKGWKLSTGVPSGAYLAAAPWLAKMIRAVDAPTARELYKAAMAAGNDGEKRTRLRLVTQVAGDVGDEQSKLATLDGDLFFDSSLANALEFPEPDLSAAVRQQLKIIGALPDPAARREGATLREPDPYFAILAMDGDNLGRHMQSRDQQQAITQALADFAADVPAVVTEHSGFLVYAGGDDLIALVPVPCALPLARTLRARYAAAFEPTQIPSTLSGGVHFVNHKLPLTHALRGAHDLLDEVAKDGRGRDAIAVQVTSRGGELIQWSQPWETALDDGAVLILEALARKMATGEAPFSNRFFHRIEDLVRLANPDPQRDTDGLEPDAAIDLFTAELLDSSVYRNRDPEGGRAETDADITTDDDPASIRERARQHVADLLGQCRPNTRRPDDSDLEVGRRIEPGGAFLVRFLARRFLEVSP